MQHLYDESLTLLQVLIKTPSFSEKEDKTAALIQNYLTQKGVKTFSKLNNIWAFNQYYDPVKPTILLNSHHDTVHPNAGYTRNPYDAAVEGDKLFGLGSNDAGGCLVALLGAFMYFYARTDLKYNICMAATAEEEISGNNGLELILPDLGKLAVAIVGEPTEMNLAIAERGLLVLDCIARGRAGHAAREEGENAIYKALHDINWFRSYQFPKLSQLFGALKMTVTMINAGTQHNVVPANCTFTVDIRVTDAYTNAEVLDIIQANVQCEVQPRSIRLKPSSIDIAHPLVQAGLALGRSTYGSPTTSDQALLNVPSLKVGPGFSGRSHMADEFIYVHEIAAGIDGYIAMLEAVV